MNDQKPNEQPETRTGFGWSALLDDWLHEAGLDPWSDFTLEHCLRRLRLELLILRNKAFIFFNKLRIGRNKLLILFLEGIHKVRVIHSSGACSSNDKSSATRAGDGRGAERKP